MERNWGQSYTIHFAGRGLYIWGQALGISLNPGRQKYRMPDAQKFTICGIEFYDFMEVPEVTNILNNPESRDGVGFWVLVIRYCLVPLCRD